MNIRRSYIHKTKAIDKGKAIFLLCAAVFVLGSVLGVVLSSKLQFDAVTKEQLSLSSEGFGEAIWTRLIYSVICLLAVTVLGFSIVGAVGVPVLLCVKGLTVAYTVSYFIRYLGGNALSHGFGGYMVLVAIEIPAVFLLSAKAFETSIEICKKTFYRNASAKETVIRYLLVLLGAVLLLVVTAFIERVLMEAV